MSKYLKELDKRIEYTIECFPEEESPEGHFSFPEDVAHVLRGLRVENEWAWCTVKVTARIPGISIEGVDYLGACSYENEASFRECPYFADMKNEAKHELIAELERTAEVLEAAGIIPFKIGD